MPNPVEDPELFATLKLNDAPSPGTVKLSGHGIIITWDVQNAPSTKGARLQLKAIPLRVFTATYSLASLEQIKAWPAYEAIILSSISGPEPVALRCYHPDAASRRITEVVLAELGGVDHTPDGGQTIVVKYQEYGPPKKKAGSPSGSSGGKGATPKPDPNAAAKAELAALLEQYKGSPWK